METRETTGGFSITGRIETSVHSECDLKSVADNYDSLTKQEKLELTKEVEPEYEDTVYNVTTDSLHQYFVDNLDPGQTSSKDNVTASWLALGTDGASGTSTGDSDLNNRVYSETVTDTADNGKEILSSTFVDSTEANGYTVDELGLFTGDPANLANSEVFMLNHATFASVTKDNSKTVTFDVTLSFSDV